MTATKQEERIALAKIRKIVESLGDNSYIGTAFAGCFELAEQNINDDAAYSLQDQVQDRDSKIAKLEAEIFSKNHEIEVLSHNAVNPNDIAYIRDLAYEKINCNIAKQSKAERTILLQAETPDSQEFRTAVFVCKNLTQENKRLHALVDRFPIQQ